MHRVMGVVLTLAVISGCTATRLRQKTDRQAATLADIHQRQVLDNLALFAYDPAALPFFAYASQGTASLSNQSGLSFTSLLTTQTQESWQLTPVNDPRKLELMRCLYQRVVAVHRHQAMPGDCPNCARLFSKFYTGDPDLRVDQSDSGGALTIDCLDGRKWLAIGCEKCAPKRSRCAVGHHCDVRVWVLPGGTDELSKLTLIILDYALHDPPATANKNVTFHLTRQGELTTAANAFADVSGQISADAANDSLMTLPYVTALNHLCAANHAGLTVDALRALDAAQFSDPSYASELRGRYHLSEDEWHQIHELLIKLKSFEVDSPLIAPAHHTPADTTTDGEATLLPAPTPE